MNAEELYERLVYRAVDNNRDRIERAARAGLAKARKAGVTDRDEMREYAVDEAETLMLNDEEFELVKAFDICDVACEIGDQVERESYGTEVI